jgi:hypothetical protein
MKTLASCLFLASAAVAAAPVAVVLPPVDPVLEFRQLAAAPAPVDCAARHLRLPVLADGLEISAGQQPGNMPGNTPGTQRVLYRMSFNQITEGWNWHPEAARVDQDYYQYKFLPIASVDESRGTYRGEDKIGTPQDFRVEWRYDYFFAFDNLYDFFARRVDDDAGFAAEIAAEVPADQVMMVADVVLRSPCVSESTTFWKAIHARPVDFTLKKRYLLGDLDAVLFLDRRTGAILHRFAK